MIIQMDTQSSPESGQIANSERDFQILFLGVSAIFFASLLYSTFLLSVAMFAMGTLGICDVTLKPLRIRLRPNLLVKVQKWMNEPVWWVITLPFLVVLFGGLYSEDSSFWLSRLRLRAPFLLLPLAWYLMPPISRNTYYRMFALFILIVFLSTIPVLWEFGANYEQVLFRLQRGHVISTPGNHIRYSLLIAICCLASFILHKRKFRWFYPEEPKIYLTLSVYFFFVLHILAIRSGIAALYLTILVFIFISLIVHRRARTLLYIVGLAAVPLITYHTLPTFRNKIQYMIEDYSRYRLKKWNAYSDSERLLSLRAGLDLASDNLLTGVGPGDLRRSMKKYFLEEYDKNTYILPHNQWISILTGSGIIGLLLILLSFFLPILNRSHFREPLFLAANSIIFFSFFAENTLETSRGVAIYIFLLLAGLKFLQNANRVENDVLDL